MDMTHEITDVAKVKHNNDQDALMPCDLVMKGGVTSGVVYPSAIRTLASKYRFCNIGGTSAGAIAAAAAAAAEYARQDGDIDGGFTRLGELQNQLTQEGFLENTIFEPANSTRPLMKTAFDILHKIKEMKQKDERASQQARNVNGEQVRHKTKERTLMRLIGPVTSALRRNVPSAFQRGALQGIFLGFIIVAVVVSLVFLAIAAITTSLSGWTNFIVPVILVSIFLALPLAWIGGLISSSYELYRIATVEVPKNNYFGLCRGHKDDPNSQALTDWLHKQINRVAFNNEAGKGETREPLTFGDLSGKGIELRMVTTNLSQGQPYVLPRQDTLLLFKRAEWQQLFPSEVVDYLTKIDSGNAVVSQALPEGFYVLPTWDKLPVIVATRMSLSAPVLICTIPLYTIKSAAWKLYSEANRDSKLTRDDLQINLFSDGGICSNFPIQFFDDWLPTQPTFGINLTSLPEDSTDNSGYVVVKGSLEDLAGPNTTNTLGNISGAKGAVDGGVKRVFLPLPADTSDTIAEWKNFTDLLGFGKAVFESTQNYRDNMQARLPSYRERVVQIRLNKDEGGINLDMPPETIRKLMDIGRDAATLLIPEDGATGRFNFEQHKWIRLRVLMAQLEVQLEQLQDSLEAESLQELLTKQRDANAPFAFTRTEAWSNYAQQKYIQGLYDLIRSWSEADTAWQGLNHDWGTDHFFDRDSPTPRPVLRISPEL